MHLPRRAPRRRRSPIRGADAIMTLRRRARRRRAVTSSRSTACSTCPPAPTCAPRSPTRSTSPTRARSRPRASTRSTARMRDEHGLGLVDAVGLALAVPRAEVRAAALAGEHPAVAATDAARRRGAGRAPRSRTRRGSYRHDAGAVAALVDKGAASAAILCSPGVGRADPRRRRSTGVAHAAEDDVLLRPSRAPAWCSARSTDAAGARSSSADRPGGRGAEQRRRGRRGPRARPTRRPAAAASRPRSSDGRRRGTRRPASASSAGRRGATARTRATGRAGARRGRGALLADVGDVARSSPRRTRSS